MLPPEEEHHDPMPADLLKTAAVGDSPFGESASAGDREELVRQMLELFDLHPGLAHRVADAIESFLKGGEGMSNMMPMPGAATPAPAPGAGPAMMPGTSGGQDMGPMSALAQRLEALESGQASIALDKELTEAQKEYERLKEHMPVLPDFNEKEIMQLSLEHNGIPLAKAVHLWAMQKAMEGEGSLADRLIAKKMEASKGANLPRVEGPGGGVPAGAEKKPTSMKEANSRAKEMLRAFFTQPGA